MNATFCKCAVILAVAAFGSFWAGKSRATCYTGCGYPMWVFDTGYNIHLKAGQNFPVMLDGDNSTITLTAACTGSTNTEYVQYDNQTTGYECSAGPSAYKHHANYTGGNSGTFLMSRCGTGCT